MQEIKSYIPNFHRMKTIFFKNIFIHKDLSFLTESSLQLEHLEFNTILFNSGVLSQLCNLDFQFLKKIHIEETGMNDQEALDLANCLRERNPNLNVFPKLTLLSFEKNYLGTEGVRSLLRLGAPILSEAIFEENMDFELFNSIFADGNSIRIQSFYSSKQFFMQVPKKCSGLTGR